MSRDPVEPPETPDPPEPHGTLRPTSPAAVTAWAVVGLVAGWVVPRLAEAAGRTAPIVTWSQPLALLLVAAILGGTAWITWRAVHVRRQRLAPHQAVNRLVLARACAYVGALAAGGYLGYALSWVGIEAQLANQRMWRSVVGAAAGVAVTVAALLLERACRVRSEGDEG